ncbi:hypothetical protein FT663_03923 [Candidozyma haemuli var. vulneris]|uniref:Vacuolar protein-sorting-associated protein 25 n=1 Tax=Candidozyma haemuli TaxID=45357 RepID=A0A2V1AVD5_9ASCO|nr:hypothetical protein CXQ85_004349 [[Candida] haemuloni]KAF3988691.1 hypothetical protein FT663_03923 [[Candida] haemuloni var. vulneris]KAF3990454.1 hypothetical protein FT662_02251 [[Candida] haemuloni var. vulneris]PVH20841.1 hypothetical protein CXQ85_004349 [[Candida] haemuloni]
MFEFPKLHSFPPFFTKQSNATILEHQLEAWSSLILSYCEYYKIYSLSGTGAVLSAQKKDVEFPPLFENKSVERACSDSFKREIFSHLIHKNDRASYIDPKKSDAGVLVHWRTLPEWAKLLRDYVDSTGQLGTILTVYELTQSEDSTTSEDFRNIDYNLFVRILQLLMKQGKAQILMAEDNSGQIEGVKIV